MTEREHVWRALADPTRRTVLDMLRERPRTTGELCAAFPLSRFAVMKHIAVLEDAGLVVPRRRGRERWNHLNAVPLKAELQRWLTPYTERFAEAALALKHAVERPPEQGDAMQDEARGLAGGQIDVVNEIEIDAPREKVFDAVVAMDRWWPHRYRADSGQVFEAQLGGRWYEDWGNGDGVLYGTVGLIERPSRLSIRGPMGMLGPVTGVWTIELDEIDGGRTRMRGTHRAFGDIPPETQQAYTQGWKGVYDALVESIGAG